MPEWIYTIIMVVIIYQFGKAMATDKANSDRIKAEIRSRDDVNRK